MAKLFGTNGIRGIFGDDLTLKNIQEIIFSISTFFKDGPILVGYDGRKSSKIISKIVCTSLNYSGIDCNISGLVPTPCLEFATKNLGYNGGIMITASHNPSQYNGIKLVADDGVEISREDEQTIENIYFNKKWNIQSNTWGKTNKEEKTIEVYLNGIKSQIDIDKIKSKKFKIVLDLGNGAQAETAPLFCEQIGCDIITINENIDGNFPGRGPEPTPENLKELSETVVKNNADLGVAFDGDGDRSLFCDDKGKILTGDTSAIFLTKYLLEKNSNSTIVTCLNSGSTIEKLTQDSSSKVIRTKVGSVEVSRKMVDTNALIGFEENGGFMYGLHNQVRDGIMTLALFLDSLTSLGKKLSEEIDILPTSYTAKDKIPCSFDDANKIINAIKKEYPSADTTDGIKVIFDEKNWVMIRPSGTEPIIRIYSEGESKKNLDDLISKFTKKITAILSV